MKIKFEKDAVKIFSQLSKTLVLAAVITLIIHCIVIVLNMSINGTKYNNIISTFTSHFFSYKMLPTLISNGLLVLVALYLFDRQKKLILKLHNIEVNNEKAKTLIETSQKTAGIMIDHISSYNNDIKEWIRERQTKCHDVPEILITSNKNIEKALFNLVKASFLFPYIDAEKVNLDEYVNSLQSTLRS